MCEGMDEENLCIDRHMWYTVTGLDYPTVKINGKMLCPTHQNFTEQFL